MKHNKFIIYSLIALLILNIIVINGREFLTTNNENITFEDVKNDFWAKEAIESLASNNILKGKGDHNFYPKAYITRAEFTTVVVNLLQLDLNKDVTNHFTDLKTSDWYYSYISVAYDYELINGVNDNSFDPMANISRQDVFTILSRVLTDYCLDKEGNKLSVSSEDLIWSFNDGESISSYAKTPINTLLSYGLISGYTNNTLKPKQLMSRSEAAAIIYRLANKYSLNTDAIVDDQEDELITNDDIIDSEITINGHYKLNESTNELTLWTDYTSERIFREDPVPNSEASGIHVYLAKNEFEPFQLVIHPSSETTIQVHVLNQLEDISIELHKVMYLDLDKSTDNMGQEGLYPDPLYPLEFGHDISLEKNVNNPLWFTLNTTKSVLEGDYIIHLSINDVIVPVNIHVFDFSIPEELHVKSQINVSTNRILEKYGVSGTNDNYWLYVDNFKQFMINHRLTPKNALWSGGLTSSGGSPYINYDSSKGELSDPHGIWGFEYPASRYITGDLNLDNQYLSSDSFNGGIGFPSFMAMTFQNNDSSLDQRPSNFDGTTLEYSDWYQSDNINSDYNQKWFKYISDIENYLTDTEYIDEAYYYMANEPQDNDDYDAIAWYSSWLKYYAPNLKLMVSEEPKSEIYNNSTYPGGKVDIWLPVLNNYDPIMSWEREANDNEESWIYFLYGTKPPYFNPITLDHPGIESKLTGWFLWKYRLKGIAHYSFNNWNRNVWEEPMVSGHNGDDFMLYPPGLNNQAIEYGGTNHRFVTSIRFELMRDSLEDYEYLYVLNNQKQPLVYINNQADSEVDKIIYGLTSYNRSSNYMYLLRKYIGDKISGNIDTIPDIEAIDKHQRADSENLDFYINFQDPNDSSINEPLVLDNKTYIKIGWNTYDESLGYGWYGDMTHVKY